jgi:hypothetical protein
MSSAYSFHFIESKPTSMGEQPVCTLNHIQKILTRYEKLLDHLVIEIFDKKLVTHTENAYSVKILNEDNDIYWRNISRIYDFQDALCENPTEESARLQRRIYPLPMRMMAVSTGFKNRKHPDLCVDIFNGMCLRSFIRFLLDLLKLGIHCNEVLFGWEVVIRTGEFYSLDLVRYAHAIHVDIFKDMDWADEIVFYRKFMHFYDISNATIYRNRSRGDIVSDVESHKLNKQERDADFRLLAHIMEYRIELLERAIGVQDYDPGSHQKEECIIPIKDFWSRTLDIVTSGNHRHTRRAISNHKDINSLFYSGFRKIKNSLPSSNTSMTCRFTHTNDTIANKKSYVSDMLGNFAICGLHDFQNFGDVVRWCGSLSFRSIASLIDEGSSEITHTITSEGVGFGTTCHAMELFWSCIMDPEVGYIVPHDTEYGKPTPLLTEYGAPFCIAIACIVSVMHGVRGRLRLHPYFFLSQFDYSHMDHKQTLVANPLYMLAFANTKSSLSMLDHHLEVLFHPNRTYYMEFANSYIDYLHYIKSHVAAEFKSVSGVTPDGSDSAWCIEFCYTIEKFIRHCANVDTSYGSKSDIANLTLAIASGGALESRRALTFADFRRCVEYKHWSDDNIRKIFEAILESYDDVKIRKFLHFVCGKEDIILSEKKIIVTFVQLHGPNLPQSSTCNKNLTIFYSHAPKSEWRREMEELLDKALEHTEYFGNI